LFSDIKLRKLKTTSGVRCRCTPTAVNTVLPQLLRPAFALLSVLSGGGGSLLGRTVFICCRSYGANCSGSML